MIKVATILDTNDHAIGHFQAAEERGKLVVTLVLDDRHSTVWQSRLSPIQEGTITLLQDDTLWIETRDRSVDVGSLTEDLTASELRLEYDAKGLDEADIAQTKLNLRTMNDRPPVPFEQLIDDTKKLTDEQ